MNIELKRVYDQASPSDGTRVLVDRIWPRGVSKQKAKLDDWWKEIAPSTELRKWFDHDEDKWADFKKKYRAELKDKKKMMDDLLSSIDQLKNITLLYGAKDTKHNHAIVLRDYLKRK